MNTKMDSLKASRVNYRPIPTHRNDTIQGDLDRPQDPNHFPNPCKYNLWSSAILKNLNEGKLLRSRINNAAMRFTSHLSANQRFFRPVVQIYLLSALNVEKIFGPRLLQYSSSQINCFKRFYFGRHSTFLRSQS